MPTYDILPESTSFQSRRNHSEWHFDYTKPPEPGADSYYHLCRFDADFSSAIKEALSGETRDNLSEKKDLLTGDIEKDKSHFTLTENDMAQIGADPYHTFFTTYDQNVQLFRDISEKHLGLINYVCRFNLQKPTQILPAHFDKFDSLEKLMPDVYKGYDFYANHDKVRRFAVMLDDWKLGQVFQLGNSTFHQWRKGDCITWSWKDMPHCTGNLGLWDRPMLQITGMITDKTRELIAIGNKDLTITL